MKIDKTESSIYIGRNAGSECLDALEHAKKSVKIVSPYLSPNYIKKLLKLHNKGINITLLTSDRIETNNRSDFDHSDIIKQNIEVNENKKNIRNVVLILSVILFLISTLGLFYRMFFFIYALSASIILFLFFKYKYRTITYSYYPIFKLRVFDSHANEDGGRGYLIHAKIYVIDDKFAFLGSTNFTHNGFVNSYESSIKFTSEKAVKKISEEVDWIYDNCELLMLDIQEWGKELYHEPIN